MAKIQTIKNKDNVTVYPQTHTQAVYDANGKKLQDWMNEYFTAEDPSVIEDVNTQFEIQGNKTNILNSDSTNIQYPGAKAVYDFVTKSIGEVAGQLKIEVVDSLPSTGDNFTIYLLSNENTEGTNVYEEYLYVNNKWELIGTTKIDLSNYYNKTEADEQFTKLSLYSDTAINIGRRANTTIGEYSVAEGYNATASGPYSHAEGGGTTASNEAAHAEGYSTTASGGTAHAEGYTTTASGTAAHAEGYNTIASGAYSHAEGADTSAYSPFSHAENHYAVASGAYSHAEGTHTEAKGEAQHVQGKWNVADTENKYAHIVGNGDSEDTRSNAHTVDWDGNAWFSGDIYVNSTSGTNKDEGSKKLATEEYTDSKITYGTTTLEDGVSELATGILYVVYEE